MSEQGYRPVHRLTPLLRFWTAILAVFTIMVLNTSLSTVSDLAHFLNEGHWGAATRWALVALGGFVAVCAGIWVVSGVWWRRMGYRLGDEEIAFRHGVLTTALRSARYERIQAVDVVEDLIARVFGLAAVRVETAGGESSAIQILYLKKQVAESVRQEILSHVHSAPAEPTDADARPMIEQVPIQRTMVAEALRPGTLLTVAAAVAVVFTPLSLAALVPFLVGMVPTVWNLVDTSWKFTLHCDEADGDTVLNLSYGLADRRRQTIRLDRIHGVRVSQPLLWRLFGWYQVHVSVAGYGAVAGKASGTTRILPVGTREQALELFELVSALSAADIEQYARPEGHTRPTYTSPDRARWVSPMDLRQQSVTLHEGVAIVHEGRLSRRVMAVETSHIQELTYMAGPFSQMLGLATVSFELVGGPVRMAGRNLDSADAAALLTRLRQRRLPDMPAEK
ncbi:PH domain-containing protein [Corynebacterium sp. zg254]|uniref:PH domain-containing protein n=1 Tax=Corynebacterium zhongnanshanii TaxID=2768834 RepID=A0ABQ6VCA4_9CORY|nr:MULTISPECIES: PH domain-containing protein [Corynebacterium]KAB3519814.1 PH domain-containing protein [Corynebacterium zhongnanshanii]MCR5914744.1 PH domain-containing protein [Corynebacterium sp. zg254]